MFALCFRVGGGIMTLGGVVQYIHNKGTPLGWAKLGVKDGFYGLSVRGVQLKVGV